MSLRFDIDTIKNTAKFANRLALESIQFMVLTPLPGTPVFEDLKQSGRLIHTDWSKYDAHHAVFEPKQMTAFELHFETLKAMSKFYSWRTIIRNLSQFDFFYAVREAMAYTTNFSVETLQALKALV